MKRLMRSFIFFCLRCLYCTYRIKEDRSQFTELIGQKETNVIIAAWHETVLFNAFFLKNKRVFALVSKSDDGRMIAELVRKNNIQSVSGSSSKSGGAALFALVKEFNKGNNILITPDGPRGPAKIVQYGVIKLAQITKGRVISMHLDIDREWRFKSWDRMRLAKPFAKITIQYQGAIDIQSKALSNEILAQRLRNVMQ